MSLMWQCMAMAMAMDAPPFMSLIWQCMAMAMAMAMAMYAPPFMSLMWQCMDMALDAPPFMSLMGQCMAMDPIHVPHGAMNGYGCYPIHDTHVAMARDVAHLMSLFKVCCM